MAHAGDAAGRDTSAPGRRGAGGTEVPDLVAPAVSVVVATHNRADSLGPTIDSVRRQTFADWELVIVDDGSTDATRALIARHEDERRIRHLFQPRAGRSAARNRGITESSGPLVALLDADDLWLPEKLAKQVAALGADPTAGLCYTAARFIDVRDARLPIREPLRAVSGHILPRLMRGNITILSSVLVRRTCLAAVGTFEPAVDACEDWDLWLRLARRYPVAVVDEELTLYRLHGDNTARADVLEAALRVVDRQYADPDMPRLARLTRAAARARLYWHDAASLATENRGAAAGLLSKALREYPRTVVSRPALGALAAWLLPPSALRAIRRLAA